MLQGFNWCSEINLTLEELFARNFIQLVRRISVCRHVSTARVVKAIDWVTTVEVLHVLIHLVAIVGCVLVLVRLLFHRFVSVEI